MGNADVARLAVARTGLGLKTGRANKGPLAEVDAIALAVDAAPVGGAAKPAEVSRLESAENGRVVVRGDCRAKRIATATNKINAMARRTTRLKCVRIVPSAKDASS